MIDQLVGGFAHALSPINILYVAFGIVIGNIVGAIPGLSRTTAVAVAIPLTFTMPVFSAIGFLVGINKGSASGSAISAILLNTPGEASGVATAMDGYPLTLKGVPRKALEVALYASVIGDFLATCALVAISAPFAAIALKIGPVEIFSIVVFSLTFIAGVSGGSLLKGLIAGALGVLFACVGLDVEAGTPRLTFGMAELYAGIPLITLGIGMLALSEMLIQMEPSAKSAIISAFDIQGDKKNNRLTLAEFRRCLKTIYRSSAIGIVVGILPGLGASVASFLSYTAAKRSDPDPGRFGKGALEGVAASEAADNAALPASMIPLFALGIPGNLAAALLIGALLIHGITPGPRVFSTDGEVVYSIFASMLIATPLLLFIGYFGLRIFAALAGLQKNIIAPSVVIFCVTGSYLDGNSMFNVYLMLMFGFIGYILKKLDFSFVTFVIGFILTPIFDLSLRQTIVMTNGDLLELINYPLAMLFICITIYSIFRSIKLENANITKIVGNQEGE